MAKATTPLLSDEQARFVERFSSVMIETGVPRMPARTLAALLCAPEDGLTAEQLSTTLHVSRAAISGAAKYLTTVGIVVRTRKPRSRVDHFALDQDVWLESFARRDAMLQRWSNALSEGVGVFTTRSAAGRRLDESRSFFEFLRSELPLMMQRWRKQRRSALSRSRVPKR